MTRTLTLLAVLTGCSATTENGDTSSDTSVDQPATFDTPESALWSAEESSYFVSNIAGESDAADGVGWIAKLDASGQVVEPRWVDGLHAPKGMALHDGTLYVADLTELVEIDVSTGDILGRVALPDALFLNDVAADDDAVWVSDTFGGAIFAYTPSTGSVTELARDEALASINGVELNGDRIVGGTTGDFYDMDDLGDLVSVSLATGAVTVLAEDVGKIDGIVSVGQGFLATDFRGMLLSIDQDGSSSMLIDLAADHGMLSAADLGYDPARDQVAVPDLFASTVQFIDLGGQ